MRQQLFTACLAAALAIPGLQSRTQAADNPSIYHVTYLAKSSGMSATAERSLTREADGTLMLVNRLELRVAGVRLGKAEERSVFLWQDEMLTSLNYIYDQSGVRDRSESVVFDWTSGTAASREEDESWNLPVTPGVTDKLNYQFLLSHILNSSTVSEIEFQVVDTNEIEQQLYRVIGSEFIDTGAGRLDTLKVERVREPDSPRQTTYWLAKDWEMLLVKLVQTSGSGGATELLLEQARIGEAQITGLP